MAASARRSSRTRRGHPVALAVAALVGCSLGAVSPSGAQLPAIATEAPLDLREGVNFHALVQPDTVYVGQQASYQVGVFLNDDVRGRLRRNPEFVPPEMAGMLSYELPVAHGMLPRGRGGQFEVHVFERAAFPLTAGTHEIPAARLSYSLPLSRSFFSREESYTLRSTPTRLVAIAPPAAGRPADYDGAVAAGLSLATRLDSAPARVGDPLLLTVRVDGTGNVNLFPRPRLTLAWGHAVPTEERVRLDTTARAIRGVKEFDWLVTPRSAGTMVVPALRYPYFDPYAEEYAVAFTRPDTLVVQPGTLATLDSAGPVSAPLTVRRTYGGPVAPPPSRSPFYWLAVAALPIPVAALGLAQRKPRRARAASAAEALAALAARDAAAAGGAGRLRALFVRAIAARVGLPRLALSRRDDVARALRREGVSRGVAADVESLLETLDHAAYAASDAGADAALARRAAELYASVDGEARERRAVPRLPIVLLAAAALAAPGIAVQATQSFEPRPAPSALFADGVRAYDARRFDEAGALFAAVTRREPRAADAWANLGTAGWAVRDSGQAAVGWQRALRLQPTARDLRPRLALLPGAQLDGAALVPPVSPAWLEWLALLAWIGAWTLLGWWLLRRRANPGASSLAGGVAAAAALVLWTAAVLLDERLAARDLAVVSVSGPARSVPALSAPAGLTIQAGEVVPVRDRRGVWARVDGPGGGGWVETARLRELRRD